MSFFMISGAHGAILVYDVCRRDSFQQLDRLENFKIKIKNLTQC